MQNRRQVLQTMLSAPLLLNTSFQKDDLKGDVKNPSRRFKLSLNAYSFNGPLTRKEITIQEVIRFCGELNLDAIDLTGYYLLGYPAVPKDEELFAIKNLIHRSGLSVSGTGIRNDFGSPDPAVRAKEVEFVKSWIEVAAKLGAPVIRIYSAKNLTEGYDWYKMADWIIDSFKECIEFGKKHGVIVAMQNHNDFILTAEHVLYFVERLDKEWFGMVVDTGNFQQHNPYDEIAKVAPYAVNWQIKELVTIKGKNEPMDLNKLMKVIVASPYTGYLPTETLSPGNPKEILPPFLQKVRAAVSAALQTH
jgi:sugar phosphate isomerase/epimerase